MLKGGRKRALPSVSDFADLVNQTLRKNVRIPVYYGQFVASTATSVANIMKTSKGRDKICSFLQYWADFYHVCVKNSNIPEIQEQFKNNQILSAALALRIKQSMSSGRKIFKFLKFLDEIKNIQAFLSKTKKPLFLKVLMTLSYISSFFYYILDNILWAIAMGILSDFFEEHEYKTWKKRKHSFSFARNILQLVINLIKFNRNKKKEKSYITDIDSMKNKIIQIEDDGYDLVRLLIRRRRKARFEALEISHSILRIVMLTKSLDLPGSDWLNPIFVSFCGLVSSHISLFKALQEKQKIIQIESNPDNKQQVLQSLKKSSSVHKSLSNNSIFEDVLE